MESSLQRLVASQLACVGTRPARFINRKRRTTNRRLADGTLVDAGASGGTGMAGEARVTAAADRVAAVAAVPAAAAPSPTTASSLRTLDDDSLHDQVAALLEPAESATIVAQLQRLNASQLEVRRRLAQVSR